MVQRRLVSALLAAPRRRFTVLELAEIAFPGEEIERKHAVSVRRALKNLPDLNLGLCRAGWPHDHGWHYVVGLAE
jgi:hypothetical protein